VTSDDGIRFRDGMPLQIVLVTNGDNPARRALAQLIVESWRAVGVDARAQFETWGSVRDRVTNTRDFQALLLGYRWEVDPDQHAMWSSDSIYDGFNFNSYVNLELDRLLDEALTETDPERRRAIYHEMQDIILREMPALPICFPNLTVALGPRLHDLELTAILVRNRATIETWEPDPGDGV
jgi:peptide/nickel transport system substrate-binding protein